MRRPAAAAAPIAALALALAALPGGAPPARAQSAADAAYTVHKVQKGDSL